MSEQSPILSYRTAEKSDSDARVSGRTLVAAGCLLFLLLCFYLSFWQFFRDQIGLFYWVERVLIVIGWDRNGAAGNTLNFFSVSPSLVANLTSDGFGSREAILLSLEQFPFAFGFGVFVAAAIFHWKISHVRWFAAAVPTAAGVFRFIELSAHTLTNPATPPMFPGAAANSSSIGLGVVTVAILIQALLAYLGAWSGRQIAVWLTRFLLPHDLSANLLPMWNKG